MIKQTWKKITVVLCLTISLISTHVVAQKNNFLIIKPTNQAVSLINKSKIENINNQLLNNKIDEFNKLSKSHSMILKDIVTKLKYYSKLVNTKKDNDFVLSKLLYNINIKIKKTQKKIRIRKLEFIKLYIEILILMKI